MKFLKELWRKWRRRRWWVRWIAYVVLPIVGFYVVEDLRGWWAWKSYRETREAQGDRFELAHYLAKEIPDEENFAATPLMQEVYLEQGKFEEPAEMGDSQWNFPAYEPLPHTYRQLCREYPFETHFDEGLFTRLEAAKEILNELRPWEALLLEIAEAAKRPGCNFPIDFERDGIKTEIRHMQAWIKLAKAYKLRSLARLKSGDQGGALRDFESFVRLNRHAKTESGLIGNVIAPAIVEAGMQTPWEGLKNRVWNDSQLVRLDTVIRALDDRKGFLNSLLVERALVLRQADRFAANPVKRFQAFDDLAQAGLLTDPPRFFFPDRIEMLHGLDRFLTRIAVTLAPRGWFWRNKVHLSRLFEPSLSNRKTSSRLSTAIDSHHPYRFLTPMLAPGGTGASMLKKITEFEMSRDLLRVAIALERFRLANHRYPKGLPELVPNFLDSVPTDQFSPTQDPVLYQLRPDGTAAIYSVGRNGIDDSGKPHESLDGDFVWQYTLPPGFTPADYSDLPVP